MMASRDKAQELSAKVRLRDETITANERQWIEIIRLASWDMDPSPTLELVQKLRTIFQK